MIITGNINYFSITECGLYKHGDSTNNGCDIGETFDLISDWLKGRNLIDTIPWDAQQSRSGHPKCYCRDLYKCETTGEYLIVLWKSDTDSAGTLWGALEEDSSGTGNVVEYTNNYKGKKIIWGRPCYYWVIPKINTILSIKFDHSVCDSQMMQNWVTSCITNRVQHANSHRELTPKGYLRISFPENNEFPDAKYAYRFNVKLCSLSTASAELQSLSTKITHIVKRETIKLQTAQDDRAAWIKIFDNIKYLNTKPKAKSRQIEVRAEAKPTPQELKEIIESFSKEHRKNSDWDNVGFETDAGQTYWVDRYRLRSQININQDKISVFSAATLYERLSSKRHELLRPLLKDIEINEQKQLTGTEK